MSLSRTIVQAWRRLKAAPLPEAARAAARLHMLDAVGVGLAASALDQGGAYRRLATGHTGVATALTGARTADPAEAALINGGLIHSLEYDDTHTASIVHGSSVLAAAALAAAEGAGQPLAAALDAYLLGYEVLIRIGLAAPGAFQARGFQITPVGGALVAALIAAELTDADEEQCVNAIGIALSQSSGVFEFLTNGSTVKSLHPGWAAHAGLIAARLAKAGMTGPETALEGTRGLYASFAGDASAGARLAGLMCDFGTRWHTMDVAFKFVPCCHYLHPFVEAAGLLADEGVHPGAIERMTLRIAPGAAGIVCEPWPLKQSPGDGHSARWSLPVVVAARLVEGKVDHDTFRAPAAPAVRALAARCTWEPLTPNRFPQAFEAEIICILKNGTALTRRIDDVYGNASRPAQTDDVRAKFRANAALALPAEAIATLETLFLSGDAPLSLFADAVARSTVRPEP